MEAKSVEDLLVELGKVEWENDERAEWLGEGIGAEEIDLECRVCDTAFSNLNERFCKECGQSRLYEEG